MFKNCEDDGKSTLLGRMLYEAQLIFDDQVDSLVKDSKRIGAQGAKIDFALLVDGLAAERPDHCAHVQVS